MKKHQGKSPYSRLNKAPFLYSTAYQKWKAAVRKWGSPYVSEALEAAIEHEALVTRLNGPLDCRRGPEGAVLHGMAAASAGAGIQVEDGVEA